MPQYYTVLFPLIERSMNHPARHIKYLSFFYFYSFV